MKWSRYEPPSREFDCAGMTIELECNKPATAAALVQTNQHRQVHRMSSRLFCGGLLAVKCFQSGKKHPLTTPERRI